MHKTATTATADAYWEATVAIATPETLILKLITKRKVLPLDFRSGIC